MRSEERKGAWVLLILIIAIGIFLCMLGRCEGNGSETSGGDDVYYRFDSLRNSHDGEADRGLDSLNCYQGKDGGNRLNGSDRYKSNSNSKTGSKSGVKSGRKRSGSGSRKAQRAAMRDILADTIRNN